jgi:hypothetical protein
VGHPVPDRRDRARPEPQSAKSGRRGRNTTQCWPWSWRPRQRSAARGLSGQEELPFTRQQPRRLGLPGAADVRCMPDLDGAETPAIRSVLPNHAAVQLNLLALVDRAATKAAVTVLACNRHRLLFPATPGTSQRDDATLGRLLSPVNSGCVTPQPVGGHLDHEAAIIMAPARGEQGGGPALGGWPIVVACREAEERADPPTALVARARVRRCRLAGMAALPKTGRGKPPAIDSTGHPTSWMRCSSSLEAGCLYDRA